MPASDTIPYLTRRELPLHKGTFFKIKQPKKRQRSRSAVLLLTLLDVILKPKEFVGHMEPMVDRGVQGVEALELLAAVGVEAVGME